MLSYQHAYHAGNPADCIKHTLWGALLAHMAEKPKPLWVAETHAGRGLYATHLPEMEKRAEYQTGLGAAWPHLPASPYRHTVDAFNPKRTLTMVPGSPAVAASVLRPGDALHLCEAHPQEHAALCQATRQFPHAGQVHVHQADGHTHIPAMVKGGQRVAVLIDPSYEVKSEYLQTAQTVAHILARNPQGTVMVWAPILPDARHQLLLAALQDLDVSATWQADYIWAPTGSGLIGTSQTVVNLPYALEDSLPILLASTVAALSHLYPQGQLSHRFLTPRR